MKLQHASAGAVRALRARGILREALTRRRLRLWLAVALAGGDLRPAPRRHARTRRRTRRRGCWIAPAASRADDRCAATSRCARPPGRGLPGRAYAALPHRPQRRRAAARDAPEQAPHGAPRAVAGLRSVRGRLAAAVPGRSPRSSARPSSATTSRPADTPACPPPPGLGWREWELPWMWLLVADARRRRVESGLGDGVRPGGMLEGRTGGSTAEGQRDGAFALLSFEEASARTRPRPSPDSTWGAIRCSSARSWARLGERVGICVLARWPAGLGSRRPCRGHGAERAPALRSRSPTCCADVVRGLRALIPGLAIEEMLAMMTRPGRRLGGGVVSADAVRPASSVSCAGPSRSSTRRRCRLPARGRARGLRVATTARCPARGDRRRSSATCAAFWRSDAGWTARWIAARPPRRPRVLDAGSGFGTYSMLYAAVGAEVIGVDLRPDRLDAARAAARVLPRVRPARRCRCATSASTSPALGRATSIWSGCTTRSRTSSRSTTSCASVREHLRPGGVLVVGDINGAHPAHLRRLAEAAHRECTRSTWRRTASGTPTPSSARSRRARCATSWTRNGLRVVHHELYWGGLGALPEPVYERLLRPLQRAVAARPAGSRAGSCVAATPA